MHPDTQAVTVYDGTAQPLCLEPTGTTDLSKVLANTCRPGTSTQRWQTRGDGTLVNLASGRCLTVLNAYTTNLAPLVLFSCNTGSNETWHLTS